MYNEKQTRKELIDHRLAEASWDVADRTQVVQEFFVAVSNKLNEPNAPYGIQYSDYVLLGKMANLWPL